MKTMSDTIEQAVQSKYASVAKSGLSTSHTGVRAVAEAFGYTPEQLASIPAEANMGLSCGNPTAFASLKPGETVVDLGCGGGLDVFLAAKRVGPSGKAVGIDMTPEMLDLARRNAAVADGGKPIRNVEFHQATIDKLPLPDASVDCVDQQLRHQPGPRQTGGLPRDRAGAEARGAAGRQRHRPEATAARRDRRRPRGLRGLHRRGHPDRRVPPLLDRRRVCPGGRY